MNPILDPLVDFDWSPYENSSEASHSSHVEKRDITENCVVDGIVIAMNKREVVVNIGFKMDGIIPMTEFRHNPELQVGDTVQVFIESKEGSNGQLILSHRKARANAAWSRVNAALDDEEVIKGYIKCRTKGGMIVDIFGIEAFLPGSQIDIVRINDLEPLVGKTMDFKVIKINDEFKNVVVSHKVIVEENLNRKTSDKTLLKEIWKKHTDVQEQILRQRTSPLSIIPSSSYIVNEKLHIQVDTSDNTGTIKDAIISSLDLKEEDCHFDDGFVLATIKKWTSVKEQLKSSIRSAANKEYVTFSMNPVIDGYVIDKRAQFTGVKQFLDVQGIEYDFDKKHRLQIAVEELNRLKDIEDFAKMQIALPDSATAIVETYPSIIEFLHRNYPNLKLSNVEVFKDNKRGIAKGININKYLVVEGGYFKQDILNETSSAFHLNLCKAEFRFKLHNNVINNYDWKSNRSGLPKLVDGCIIFTRDVKIKPEILNEDNKFEPEITSFITETNEIIQEVEYEMNHDDFFNSKDTTDINFEYMLLNNLMKRLFGENNYDFEQAYHYKYKDNRTWVTPEELDKFNDLLHVSISPHCSSF